jgi:hypothetical protein
MILDMLLRLAQSDAYPRPRDLAVIAKEYVGLSISKDDPYRKRYGEIIGRDWESVEPGFFAYAIKDPIATWYAYAALRRRAEEVAREAGVDEVTIRRYGPLGESIQVKGALALAAIERHELHLDQGYATTMHRSLLDRLAGQVARLRARPESADMFQVDRAGAIRMTSNQAPRIRQKVLRQVLAGIATEHQQQAGWSLRIAQTKTGISASTRAWAEYSDLHPFLADWIAMAETCKLAQFFGGLGTAVVRPSYTIMVRTGRTSCSGPNIQQIPRKGGFREIFVARPGHLLLAVDYSFIELRTLAAVCLALFGRSTLADVIRAGIDPHAYTAAMLLGMDLDEFMAMEQTDPDRFEEQRRLAKPLNFGIPGGLGVASLVHYAHSSYGVELTPDQARQFREKLIKEVYPELDLYLSEDSMGLLARNLGVPVEACWAQFDWTGSRSQAVAGGIRNVARGRTCKADGTPYSPRFAGRAWDGLIALAGDGELAPLLAGRAGGEDLARRLFHSGVATLTGRVRGRVGYSQARNTPFQGLAADGAKLALWRLVREGYRVVGFVHDEILVELPDEGGSVALAEVERVKSIMCREMASVLVGDIPVDCKAALSARWSKAAKLVVRGDGAYPQ